MLYSIVTGFEKDKELITRDIFKNMDIPAKMDLMFLRADLEINVKYYPDCIKIDCEEIEMC